ncbi:MAG: hypothetical protein AB8B53_00625 [Flavobacteriales bacterium]
MKILEKTLIVLLLIGALFKLMHWPGAGPLFVIGLTFLSMTYFIFSFFLFHGIGFRQIFKKESYSAIGHKTAIFSILAGLFCLSTLLVGIMFRIQFWPGANVMLTAALPPTLILIIIAVVKRKNSVAKSYLYRALPFGVIGAVLLTFSGREVSHLLRPGYDEVYAAEQSLTEGTEDEYNRKVRWLKDRYYYHRTGAPNQYNNSFQDGVYSTGLGTYVLMINANNDTLFESPKDFHHMEISDLDYDGLDDFTTYDLDGNSKDHYYDSNAQIFISK